eukprot:SAG31_NODE_11_length_38734_cov_21.263854_9_plen_118_part_00
MTTYIDLLPDDLYIKIYEEVNRSTLESAAKIGKRRNIPKIGKKTNDVVLWNWVNGKPFKSLSMHTNGEDLYSYQLQIGHTENDKKILKDYTAKAHGCFSQTTSTHVNKARKYADEII